MVLDACDAEVLPAEGVVVVLEAAALGVVEVLGVAGLVAGVELLAGPAAAGRAEAVAGRVAVVGLMSRKPTHLKGQHLISRLEMLICRGVG